MNTIFEDLLEDTMNLYFAAKKVDKERATKKNLISAMLRLISKVYYKFRPCIILESLT